MMKILWIPIALFIFSLTAYMVAIWGTDGATTLKMLIGQGVMIPFFFFVLLFIWRFNQQHKKSYTA
ncbi:hypothetical protein ACFSY7_08580 [Kurthia populi]|uniref:DUF4017 domain-containing protein n=1 Tax=Kurthia populi TaxID=1562132 RepID=A0ABW5XZP3_9BACL|nr:hypothetical protein [Candidatus Kurthia intestinigallinarum]